MDCKKNYDFDMGSLCPIWCDLAKILKNLNEYKSLLRYFMVYSKFK